MAYVPPNPNGQATMANSSPVVIASDQSAVPVSASSLPLPTLAATSTKQSDGSQKTQIVDASGNVASLTSNAQDVNLKTSSITLPISASTLPLPTGASTAAKQPALGTAGTASTDVISVQGIASMTPLKIDGSGVTQPVSGTVTANAGTNLNTSALALESGGNLAALVGDMTNGTQTSRLTDGTNTANVVAGDTGFNGVATAGASKQYTFTTSSSGAQVIGPWNLEGYLFLEVNFTSVGSGLALTGQFAPTGGGTYVTFSSFYTTNGTPGGIGTSANITYYSVAKGNMLQLNVTALTSGTFSGTVTLRSQVPPYATLNATQSGTWTVGSSSGTGASVPANAFYMGVHNSANQLQGLVTAQSAGVNSVGGDNLQPNGSYTYNVSGTSWNAMRDANTAAGTTGIGLLGVGLLEWDGTNYQRVPAGRFSPASTKLNTNSYHITTNTTNTPTASTAYISSIAISAEVGGTTSTITIQDKQGTPLKLVNGLATTAVTSTPTIINFQTPVLMTSGIDIITAGAVAGTVDVWVNWFQ